MNKMFVTIIFSLKFSIIVFIDFTLLYGLA